MTNIFRVLLDWKFISIRPGQTGLCQSNPHSYMPLSLCDISVLLHGIITSNTAEAFFLYFCCKAIREQTEVAYDLIGPTQYQRRKRYRILNFKSHTTHYPFFHRQITQNVSTKWVPKSSSWKVFGINHPQTLSTEKSFLLIPKTLQGLHFFVFWGTHLVDAKYHFFSGTMALLYLFLLRSGYLNMSTFYSFTSICTNIMDLTL